MSTKYPGSLDDSSSLPQPSSSSAPNNPSHAGLHDTEIAAIEALEAKLGTGTGTTPTAGKLLLGTGAGTSDWASSIPESSVTNLTSDLASKASAATTITTGTGLSGGGDLSANRTLSVVPNTTNQQVTVDNNGTSVATRKEINFIPGANVTLGVTDNATSDRVDVTINSTGGGSGGSVAWGGITGTLSNQVDLQAALTNPSVNSIKDTNGNVVLLLPANASAVNYLTINNAATGSAVTFQANGSDTNIDMTFKAKGTGTTKIQSGVNGFSISNFSGVSSAVNYMLHTNAATGSDPSIAAAGSDTNVSLNLKSKGTGTVKVNGTSLGSLATKSSVTLTTDVTGTLPVANGGTGAATLTGILKGNGTAAFTAATAGTDYTTPTGTESLSNKTLVSPVINTGTVGADPTTNLGIASKQYIDNSTPSGIILPFAGRFAPTGFFLCYGQALLRSQYAALFNTIVPLVGNPTITIASPGVFTLNAHGFNNGDPVYLTTTGTLPTGLSANTIYYVVSVTTNTFQLATSRGGTPINTSGTQSGTHSVYYCPYGLGDGSTTFNVPDLRGRVIAGVDMMGGTAANNLLPNSGLGVYGNQGASGGEPAHLLSIPEMPAHTHTQNLGGTLSTVVNAAGSFVVGNANTSTTQSTGGGGSHNNIQPTLVCNYIIKT